MSLPMVRPSASPLPRQAQSVIAVASGKGGVGKSTVCASLAVALRQAGYAVGILDADLYGPTMAHLLPETEPAQLREGRLHPAICSGVRLLSMAHFRPEWRSVALRAPMANGILSQFLQQVDWGKLDYLLIDFPPGTGDIQLTLCQAAAISAALIVTTPQEVALLDVRRTCHLFGEVKLPLLGVVENMSYLEVAGSRLTPYGSGGGERIAAEFGAPLLAQIPLDPDLCARCESREVGSWSQEGSQPLFRELAAAVAERLASSARQRIEVAVQEGEMVLTWPEGERCAIALSALQRSCPCAACLGGKGKVADDVAVRAIYPVGHYAIRCDFTTGCSSGIYPFELLREVSLK